MTRRNTNTSREGSWPLAAGLLTGCMVTLIGVALSLPPTTILFRSTTSGCIVAFMVLILSFGWKLVTPRNEED
jgi:hypothetical protein